MSITMGRSRVKRAIVVKSSNCVKCVNKVKGTMRSAVLRAAAVEGLIMFPTGTLIRVGRMRKAAIVREIFSSSRSLMGKRINRLLKIGGGSRHVEFKGK